jgi:hypothetical protein
MMDANPRVMSVSMLKTTEVFMSFRMLSISELGEWALALARFHVCFFINVCKSCVGCFKQV